MNKAYPIIGICSCLILANGCAPSDSNSAQTNIQYDSTLLLKNEAKDTIDKAVLLEKQKQIKNVILKYTNSINVFSLLDDYEQELLKNNLLESDDNAGYMKLLDTIITTGSLFTLPEPKNSKEWIAADMNFMRDLSQLVVELKKITDDLPENNSLRQLANFPDYLAGKQGDQPSGPTAIARKLKSYFKNDELDDDFYQEMLLFYIITI